MKTTDFILELIIAGLGTLVWVILLFLGIIDVNWQLVGSLFELDGFFGFATIVVLLIAPFIYIIGIVTDRLVDNLFDNWFANRIAQEEFGSDRRAYKRAVCRTYMAPQGLKEAFTYSRMRIRICRAWAYNSTMILVSMNVFLILRRDWFPQALQMSIFFSILFIISTVVSFHAWKSLVKKEYFSLKINQELLAEMERLKQKKTHN